MNKRAFYQNTAVMTATSLLLRLLGIVFRIFISNRVGAEGMGLYQLVFSVYILGATFATGGLVTAVTCLVAQRLTCSDSRGVRRLMRISILLCIGVGGVSALLLYVGAPLIGGWMGDFRAVPAIAISGIALPFIGVSACIKGYFMARRKAWPPCLSQIVEQSVRIGGILWMLSTYWDGSLAGACVIIIVGDALSETVACVYLFFAYRRDRKQLPQSTHTTSQRALKPLLNIALPLTAGRYLTTVLRTVENFLVPACLTLYTHSKALSLAQFGAVKGMALPLIFFPSALLMTLSGLLIPELSDAHALGHRRQVTRLTERTLHVTLLGSILVGGLFTVLGRPLGDLLYHDSLVGMLLQILGPLTPVMYLDSVVSGMLKGLNQQVHSLWFAVADSVVRIGLIYLLLPHFGLTGFLYVMLVSNLLTATLSTSRLLAVSRTPMNWGRWVIRPAFAAVVAGGCAWLFRQLFPTLLGLPSVLPHGIVFVTIYCLLITLLGCFTRTDWQDLTAKKTAVG